MQREFIVRGNLSDPSHIELEEPVSDIHGAVEVTVRPIDEVGSPAAILKIVRGLPQLAAGDVDELERMIEAGKLSTRTEGIFDAE